MSAERTQHLEENEKWIMRVCVGFSFLAIASFTYTKWEVQSRLEQELNEEERKDWYAGTYDHEKAQQKRREREMHPTRRTAAQLLPVKVEGFIPAASFEGSREGMVFKSDLAGLGYYVDQPIEERVQQ